MCLSAPGIFYSWELFVLWYCLQPRKLLCSFFKRALFLHDYWNGLLVSVHFQINYLLFHSQNQRQYQPPNRLKHYSKLTSLFHLLLMWCSTDENSWGLHFTCILQYCSTRTRKFVCVQTFVCVWVPVLFILIAYLRKYAANLFLC